MITYFDRQYAGPAASSWTGGFGAGSDHLRQRKTELYTHKFLSARVRSRRGLWFRIGEAACVGERQLQRVGESQDVAHDRERPGQPALLSRSALVRPRGWLGAALAALAAAVVGWPSAAMAGSAVRLSAGFDRGARLGASTGLNARLNVDVNRLPSPVAELRLFVPAGLGIVSSGLGLASCIRPAADFQAVLVSAPALATCSPNAVIGSGTAVAQVRLSAGEAIPEYASVTLLAGALQPGGLGLVINVEGQHPFGGHLVYAGELRPARSPFGGVILARLLSIPSELVSAVALVSLQLSIGSRAITYYRHPAHHAGSYHPDGIALPDHCPRHGFRFRAALTFQNGRHATAETTVSCAGLRVATG